MTKKYFINISNHPSTKWGGKQLNAARSLGDIVDIPFPAVPPTALEDDIERMAGEVVAKVLEIGHGTSVVAHVMGEMTLTHAIVNKLSDFDITCVASTTQRISKEMPDGTKQSTFDFVMFRQYD